VVWFCYWTPGAGAAWAPYATDNAIITPRRGPDGAIHMVQGPHYAHARRINSVLRVYGNFLLGAKSTGVWYGQGTASDTTGRGHVELPPASAIRRVNNTGAGPTFEVLVGQFELRPASHSALAAAASKAGEIAIVLHNQDHAASLLASLTFPRGVAPPCASVKELDPSTGQLAPAWDDAPNSPGFQLLLEAGAARLLVLPGRLARGLKTDDEPFGAGPYGIVVRPAKPAPALC
jgi:hypothetical protein